MIYRISAVLLYKITILKLYVIPQNKPTKVFNWFSAVDLLSVMHGMINVKQYKMLSLYYSSFILPLTQSVP